jgi:hypothetical protein
MAGPLLRCADLLLFSAMGAFAGVYLVDGTLDIVLTTQVLLYSSVYIGVTRFCSDTILFFAWSASALTTVLIANSLGYGLLEKGVAVFSCTVFTPCIYYAVGTETRCERVHVPESATTATSFYKLQAWPNPTLVTRVEVLPAELTTGSKKTAWLRL